MVRRLVRVLAVLAVAASWSAAQEARAIEVVGPAEVPSHALLQQVKKGEDAVLWFDVGYGVRRAVVRLHEEWGRIERQRAEAMQQLTEAMIERAARGDAFEDPTCAGVAKVALALLTSSDPTRAESAPTGAAGDERDDVLRGGAGTLRFLDGKPACDWKDAEPRGGYAAERGGFGGVFRATKYIAKYMQGWPASTTRRWNGLAAACRAAGVARELTDAGTAMAILFGASLDACGVPVPASASDLAWLSDRALLRERADAQRPPRGVLQQLFADVAMPDPRAMSDGVLRLCHALVEARPDSPLLAELTPAQWRAKWLDAATFAYAGLREVDQLVRAVGREQLPKARVLVEPLPEVWRALRWLDLREQALFRLRQGQPDDGASESASWVDPVLAALERQSRGEEIDAELNDRLAAMLLESFDEPDILQGTPSAIEGVKGDVRRATPQLVRIPVRWRGEVVRAVALRLYVEHQDAAGQWQPSPWNVAIDPTAAATAFR